MMQSYQQMNAQQRAQLAQALQLDPQELQATMQMMQQLPPGMVQQMLAGRMGGGGDGIFPPGAHVVHLTQEQADAIGRLQELGFSRQNCVEALLACDNNEEMAANYLFSNGGGGGEGEDGNEDDDAP
jgi:UV excision repair protein RAD23